MLANRSCSAPPREAAGPRAASGGRVGSGALGSRGGGSLRWCPRWRRRQRRQDDGRSTDRLRGRREARSGDRDARARAGALTPGGRSRRAAPRLEPQLRLAALSHTEIARFAARLPRLLGRFRLAHFRVEARLAEWRHRRPMRSGQDSWDPRPMGGVASLTMDSARPPMRALAGSPSGSRRRPGRA